MNSSAVDDVVETHDHLNELRHQEEVKTLTTCCVELIGVAIDLWLHIFIWLQVNISHREGKAAQGSLDCVPAVLNNSDAFGLG